MKQDKTIVILGIVAIIAIVILVLLFKTAITGEVVWRYPPTTPAKMYPTSSARLHCELPEPRLDLTKEDCRRIGWWQCQQLHGAESRVTSCLQFCGWEIANMCRKAHGDPLYGIGIRYTYEPKMGLRRPVGLE